jgi:hypothetical protein
MHASGSGSAGRRAGEPRLDEPSLGLALLIARRTLNAIKGRDTPDFD